MVNSDEFVNIVEKSPNIPDAAKRCGLTRSGVVARLKSLGYTDPNDVVNYGHGPNFDDDAPVMDGFETLTPWQKYVYGKMCKDNELSEDSRQFDKIEQMWNR